MTSFYYFVSALVRSSLFLLVRYRVKGRENVPQKGPLIIVANHLHNVDPPVLGVSIPRKVIFMAKGELFCNSVFGPLVRLCDALPVYRGSLNRGVIRQAREALSNDMVLGIFPEGSRSRDAQLKGAFSGAAFIALYSAAPLLPVAITGTEKIKGVTWFLRRPEVSVTIGCPFYLPPQESKVTMEQLEQGTKLIMSRIAELLPQDYQGEYHGGNTSTGGEEEIVY
jgi:1-acyl-sn-glycerol-3-phosphate acyltransferase